MSPGPEGVTMTTTKSREAAPASDQPRPTRTGWWTESISDGGGHYGHLRRDGQVHSLCGVKFAPLPHAITGELESMPVPADRAHACPRCWEQRAAST